PQNDIERATHIARQMVTQWGMSERLGPRTFGRKEELIFLGREIAEQRNYSEKVAEEIDEEVRRIIDKAYHTAKKVLTENREKLDQIVEVLLEVETIEGEDLQKLLSTSVEEWRAIREQQKAGTPPSAPGTPAEAKLPAEESSTQPQVGKPGLAWGAQANIAVEGPGGPST
ncbi:MAG TPA: hypothetical protein VNM43_11045, partial [Dehalococcoidia bacterium]|nr:hypothetical protein [Dehalococcoidia bacterium]